jgi:hypothetical protein
MMSDNAVDPFLSSTCSAGGRERLDRIMHWKPLGKERLLQPGATARIETEESHKFGPSNTRQESGFRPS